MASYENEPFIIGDYQHNRIEFMHLYHQKWYLAPNFYDDPEKPFYGYSAVSRSGKLFIFGGCCEQWSTVSIFENHKWKRHGQLLYGRMNFMTITYGTDVMILGGTTENKES